MKQGYFTILILFYSLVANAQLVVDGAAITIGADAKVDIIGDVDNGGSIFNFGEIAYTGNWENETEYNDWGTVRLIGFDQNIISNGGAYNNLIVEGGGIKGITGNCNIKNQLNLSTGYVKPEEGSEFIVADTAEITGGDEFSFVDGFLYLEGSGTKFFPVGSVYEGAAYYRPSELHGIVSNAGVLGMRYVRDEAQMESIQTTNRIRQISPFGFWELDVASGSLSEAFLSIAYNLGEDFTTVMDDNAIIDIAVGDSLSDIFEATFVDKEYFSTKFNGINHITSMDTVKSRFFLLGEMFASNRELLYIPNALSASAPSTDDQAIKVYGDILADYNFYFKVENQWGNTIFETSSLREMETEGWRGRNQRTGKMEMTGQYQFIVKATFLDGTTYQDAGSIWIIN